MKVFRATGKDQYIQPVEFDPGRYTFHAVVKGEAYSFALKTESGAWLNFDLSWQLEEGEWSRVAHTFELTEKCVEFSLFASETTSEVLIGDPMFEEGNNRSTPSPHPADGFEQTQVSFDILDDKIVAEITGENGRLTKAEQTLESIETTVYDPDTGESKITQLADEIDLRVDNLEDDLEATGINIRDKEITLIANRVKFKSNSGADVPLFNEDGTKINANEIELTGDDDISEGLADAQQAADDAMDKASKSDYLREALQQSTEIEGGLILGSVIAARDTAGVVRSYQNGDPELNNTAFASGVDNFGLPNETRKTGLNHDGSGQLASGNIQWDAAGNTLHKGATASPFQRTGSIYTNTFSNNLIVTGNFSLPWDEKGSGRLIRLIQPKSGSVECIAPAFLDPNDKRYFYEDGVQKDKLKLIGQEIVELLGYTDSLGVFKGWLVLNRGLMHTVSTWGEPHRIIAQGHVSDTSIKYHTFDGSDLIITRHSFTDPAYKTVTVDMNSLWFDSDDGYYVKIIGNNGNYSLLHTTSKLGIINNRRRFQVAPYQLSGGNIISSNVIGFYFEIYSAAWMYPKTGTGGGGAMPGEEW